MFERQIEIPSAEEIRERTPLPAALAVPPCGLEVWRTAPGKTGSALEIVR